MNRHSIVKGKLICVALNDSEQLSAMQQEFSEAPYKAPPTQPVLYFKPHNTWNTQAATIDWPSTGGPLYVGASLAVVVATKCTRVSAEQALEYVAGFSILHDFSLQEKSYYRPDIKGKCLDGTAPLGAKVTPIDQVSDLSALSVITEVNGELASEFPLSQMQRSVPELISSISYIMTLEPGDVIAVGFKGERILLNKGDKVCSAIAGVTELSNQVAG
ncbi:MAG: hypothetical protein OFPI_40540 [Osedax symbiont Rs2]|nr:MAG: hypothetical protein OFPI_40540 [Osedax symbiont Rs2]